MLKAEEVQQGIKAANEEASTEGPVCYQLQQQQQQQGREGASEVPWSSHYTSEDRSPGSVGLPGSTGISKSHSQQQAICILFQGFFDE